MSLSILVVRDCQCVMLTERIEEGDDSTQCGSHMRSPENVALTKQAERSHDTDSTCSVTNVLWRMLSEYVVIFCNLLKSRLKSSHWTRNSFECEDVARQR